MPTIITEPGQTGNPLNDAVRAQLEALTNTDNLAGHHVVVRGDENLRITVVQGKRDGQYVVATYGGGSVPGAGTFKAGDEGKSMQYRSEFYSVVSSPEEIAPVAAILSALVAGVAEGKQLLPPFSVVRGLTIPENFAGKTLFITPQPFGVKRDDYAMEPVMYNEEFGIFFMHVTFVTDEEAEWLQSPEGAQKLQEARVAAGEDAYRVFTANTHDAAEDANENA